MNSHEVVCLSSDDEEKSKVPVTVSSISVKSVNSTVEILSDTEDVPNGTSTVKEGEDKKEDDDCNDAEPSTSGSSGPPNKKRRVELTSVKDSESANTTDEPKKKSKKSILIEENKKLFEEFLKKCEEIDGTADMKKGTAKARKHFECSQVEYQISKEFRNTLEMNLTKVNKDCVWGYLGELVKQLKLYKEREGDLTGSQKERDLIKERLAATDKDKYYEILKNEEDERIVRKLHRILKKIHKQIIKLESQEVDFDDDNDSTYIMTERYKARASKVYEKLCKYTKYPEHADRQTKRKITFSGTDIPSVNKCIERFVNKNHTFPDYHDVLKLIQTVNNSESLNISPHDMKIMASKVFREIGREIKKRRQWDVEDSLYIHLDRGDFNPESYENDPELEAKLDENGKRFVQKFNEMIEEYTQKQLKEQKSDEDKAGSANGENGGSSAEANSGAEEEEGEGENNGKKADSDKEDSSQKEDDDESDEEASDIEKPVDEEFLSEMELGSDDPNSSSDEEHGDVAEQDEVEQDDTEQDEIEQDDAEQDKVEQDVAEQDVAMS